MPLLAILAFAVAAASGDSPPGPGQPALVSPYRAQQSGPLRGMTVGELRDLQEGRGMGLARAAELNGYPGPRHVLDASRAGELGLSPQQVSAVTAVFDTMSEQARRLGGQVLAEERQLEETFRRREGAEADMRERVSRIARLLGEIRAVHLRAHLETRALLTDAQVRRYQEIRGYAEGAAPSDPDAGRRHRH